MASEPGKVASFLDRHAAPNWRNAHRLWSVQLTVGTAFLEGAYVGFPVFQSYISPIPFFCICIGLSLAAALARLVKQRLDPDDV